MSNGGCCSNINTPGWLRKNPNVTIVLEGHADERGTREYNLALGERRANAAKDYLMTMVFLRTEYQF